MRLLIDVAILKGNLKMYVKFQNAAGPNEVSEPKQSYKGTPVEGNIVWSVCQTGQGEEIIQYWSEKGRGWPGIEW